MPKYRPKNIEVEAMQFTRENAKEFKEWVLKQPTIVNCSQVEKPHAWLNGMISFITHSKGYICEARENHWAVLGGKGDLRIYSDDSFEEEFEGKTNIAKKLEDLPVDFVEENPYEFVRLDDVFELLNLKRSFEIEEEEEND